MIGILIAPLLGGVASSIIGGLFGNNRQNKQHQQAKDLAQQQLDNSMRQGQQAFDFRRQEADQNYWLTRGLADQDFGFKKTLADDNYGFQIRKANVDDEITRRQNEQSFGFQRTLANDNYSFQDKQRAERERANDEAMERDYQMRTETTNRARQAASRAFFGRRNRFNARR